MSQGMFKKRQPKLLYYYSLPREPIPVNDIPDPSTSDLLELPEIRVTSPSFLGREEVIVQKGKNPQLSEDNAISDVTTETDAICNGAEKETITIRRVHEDEVDRLPQRLRVETFDLLCYLFSIFTYVTDLCLDVVVAYMHYASERYWSCAIIASLVVFPSLILNILAAIWWIDDDLSQRQKLKRLSHRDRYSLAHRHHRIHKRSLTTRLLICVLQLGPVLWYWEALEAALRYRKEIKKPEQKRNPKFALKYYCEMVEAERDASLLRFFESFLESVPQLLVQGFLLAETFWKIHASEELAIIPDWARVQCISMAFSLLSASWSIVAQHRSLRMACSSKVNMTYRDSMLQLTWHVFTITSRYICLIMFTVAFREWILAVFAIHYLVSVLHVSILQRVSTGTSFACMDIGLTMINAAIHLFTPFNMAEGTTRWQYSAAYAIEFLEDMVLMCLCLFNPAFDFPFKWYIAAVALGCFVIGIAVMLAYYEFFHPSRRRNCARHFQKCEPLAVSITQTKKKELVITNGVKTNKVVIEGIILHMWTLFIAIFSTLFSANAYKILFFAPSLGKSHLIFQSRIADAIAKAGHEVVMFEPEYHYDPESLPGAEVAERYILKGLREKVNISDDHGEIITDAFADMTMSQGYQITRAFQRRLVPTCEEIIKRTDIIEDLRKRKFDAYISEPLGCDNGFAHLIGISTYIMLTSLPFLDHYTVAMRMPLTASYVPSIIFESYGDEMTYWERVYNWYSTLAGHYNIETSLDDHTQMFRKHFGPAFPSTQSLFQNASLIFVNTDEFVDFPRPTQDNIVNIGGIGLDRKNGTLEEPFKSQARMGKLGSVVISFGTHVPTATLPIAFKRNLVTALVSLPNYHFIVRVDKGDLATMKSWLGGAKNVYFTDWTPQAALLHDTNVVAFVSHMGANSLMEAAYNGKVVLCMPFAFDQNRNCRSAVRNGWAKYFSRTELLDGPDTFKAAIINLLEGESGAGYRANAARVKQLIKNKPLSSEERLRKYIHLLEPWSSLKLRKPNVAHHEEINDYCDSFDVDIHPDAYPSARRNESVVEKFFCKHQIADPYRWMENPDSKETKRFIKQLNSMSRPFFEKSYSRDKFREKLTKIYDQKMYGCVSKHGDHYYYFYNSGLQNHSVLYRQHSFDDKEEIFLDPNTLSVDGTTSLSQTSFSRDGKVLAYAISEKGSDITTVKFRDSSGSDLKDTITDVKHTSISWSPKNDGIFYSKYTNHKKASNETDVESDEYHSLFFHRLGSKSDILIADFREFGNPHLAITGSVSADGRFLFVYVYDSKSSNNVYYYDLKSIDYQVHKKLNLTLIFQDPHAFFAVVDYDYETDRALALTNHAAPMWKLIRVKLETAILGCAHWETVIEEDANRTLNAVVPVAGDKLMVQYLEDVKTSLYVHSQKTGELLYSIPLGIGAVSQCYGDKNDTEAFFSFSSFLEPTRFFRVDFSQVEKTDLIKLEEIRRTQFLGVDTSNFVVKQEFYRSKDGTKVPLFIIHNKDIVMDGKNPTILYGYGGFNIPVLPSYSSQRNLFIKHFRGVAAVANIRGGGEYGDKWHERGIREHKQNVFDDFISAAEYLIEKNYTTPKKLAIQGGSNGGLLVAACSQQRPELFGAVINQVGVMDMLRFHKFTVGSSWIYEYGDPDKPIDFEYIYKYSPLHNARLPNGIQWPATLLMTADHDDRVVPSHTLKYIAELYHYFQDPKRKLIQRNPVIAHVETDAGHGAGKSISKSIDESADIMSFLQRVLHMKWYD